MPNFIDLIPQLQKCVVSQDNTLDKNCTKVVIKALNHLRSMTFVCSMHQDEMVHCAFSSHRLIVILIQNIIVSETTSYYE